MTLAQEQKRMRNLHKMQQARKRAAAKAAKKRFARIVTETGKRHPGCTCGITPTMRPEDLRALGGGCTDPQYVCPRLDSVRRQVIG